MPEENHQVRLGNFVIFNRAVKLIHLPEKWLLAAACRRRVVVVCLCCSWDELVINICLHYNHKVFIIIIIIIVVVVIKFAFVLISIECPSTPLHSVPFMHIPNPFIP
jgi:hypothetical protein